MDGAAAGTSRGGVAGGGSTFPGDGTTRVGARARRGGVPVVGLAALLLACVLSSGCAVTVKGIVQTTPFGVRVEGYNGGSVGLRLEGDSRALWDLEGCVVEVEGPRIGPWVWVRDWKVRDAGYGFGAWVGELHVEGFQYLLDDRNTGHTVVLDVLAGWELEQYDGETILAVGPVVGSNTVQVMVWRVLDGR